jgi:RNA polymerase sigma factor (sigma-70 family)
MKDSDGCDLLRRCLADRRAGDWQVLIDRLGREVRLTVQQTAHQCGLLLDDPDLDELVQDFYCRLLALRGRQFEGRSDHELWRYVMCVARSLVVDRLRQLGARKRCPSTRGRSADPSPLRSPKLDPEQRLLKKERRHVFFQRCFEIVRCDRVALELRALAMALLEGWSSREIADELEGRLSAARVDKLVSLLRRRLLRDGIRMPRRYCVSVQVPSPA